MMSHGSGQIHPAALPVDRLLAECDVRRTRRSGPGGQHRNKVETAVVLMHRPSGLSAEASERRSQSENHAVALFRLRLNLALQIRTPLIAGKTPSERWQARCRDRKIAVNTHHDDFPAILAEALDVIALRHMDLRAAGDDLACTPSQLTKLLQQEPRALALVNRERNALGLHPLK